MAATPTNMPFSSSRCVLMSTHSVLFADQCHDIFATQACVWISVAIPIYANARTIQQTSASEDPSQLCSRWTTLQCDHTHRYLCSQFHVGKTCRNRSSSSLVDSSSGDERYASGSRVPGNLPITSLSSSSDSRTSHNPTTVSAPLSTPSFFFSSSKYQSNCSALGVLRYIEYNDGVRRIIYVGHAELGIAKKYKPNRWQLRLTPSDCSKSSTFSRSMTSRHRNTLDIHRPL